MSARALRSANRLAIGARVAQRNWESKVNTERSQKSGLQSNEQGIRSTMTPRLTPTFLLFSVAILLWSSSVSLSVWLGDSGTLDRHEAVKRGTAEPSATVKEAKAALDKEPKSVTRRLELARAIHSQAVEEKSGELLMEAVKAYTAVFEIEKEQPDALRGLASLCLEAGIIAKAIEYRPRYLAQRPDDLSAQIDYSLALIQAGQADKAIDMLKAQIQRPDAPFQSVVALALAYKLQGDRESARKYALQAKERTDSEEARKRIDDFLASLDEPIPSEGEEGSVGAAAAMPAEQLSPGRAVSDFFSNHPIIGPKLRGVSWPTLTRAKVLVADFPVEQMPPFAKEKFLSNVRSSLAILPERITVALHDAVSDRELLTVEVGGGADSAGAGDAAKAGASAPDAAPGTAAAGPGAGVAASEGAVPVP